MDFGDSQGGKPQGVNLLVAGWLNCVDGPLASAAATSGLTPSAAPGGPTTLTRAVSLGLGAGGLGYSAFWLMAAFRLPGVGSSAAAKESLAWLEVPASGAFVVATITLCVMILAAMRRKPPVASLKTLTTIPTGEVALKES